MTKKCDCLDVALEAFLDNKICDIPYLEFTHTTDIKIIDQKLYYVYLSKIYCKFHDKNFSYTSKEEVKNENWKIITESSAAL